MIALLLSWLNGNLPSGADVVHPAPGSEGRPSFTALVANLDSDSAKYIAQTRVQVSRQEMIEDLEEMAFVGQIVHVIIILGANILNS